MPALNVFICTGYLARPVEFKTTDNGSSLVRGCVAVAHPWKKDSPPFWCNFSAFGKTADFIGQYFDKGDCITLQGAIVQRDVEKDGEKKTYISMEVNQASFGDSKTTSRQTNSAAPAPARSSDRTAPRSDPHDDLPF